MGGRWWRKREVLGGALGEDDSVMSVVSMIGSWKEPCRLGEERCENRDRRPGRRDAPTRPGDWRAQS